jgi:hypothetical protein
VNKLIGGRRIVHALGADDDPLAWSGIFLFASALDRARYLDSLRRTGQVCTLTWDVMRYSVVVDAFHADYEKPFKIPYSISCTVIEDQTSTLDNVPGITPAQALSTDMARMGTLSNCIGDSTLNGLTGSLSSALAAVQAAAQPMANGLKAVTSFISGVANCAEQIENTVASAVSSIVGPLAAVASHVQSMISTAEGALATGSGVLPGLPVSLTAFNVLAKLNSAVQLPELYELRSITARMQVNLPMVATPTSARTITVGGGNLYSIAAQQYGDASRFTDIMAANGLTDPVLTGINTLTIPA